MQSDAISEIKTWRNDRSTVGRKAFPYRSIVHEIQTRGKHFLSTELLRELDDVRAEGAADRLLDQFLTSVLDKYDDRYQYQSYLALPVLADLVDGQAGIDALNLAGLLVSDAIQFELTALHGWHDRLATERPNGKLVAKRTRLGLRHLVRSGVIAGEPGLTTLADRAEDPDGARELLDLLPVPRTADVALRLSISVQPVHVLHDEYLFLRVLQSYESVFAGLVRYSATALRQLRSRQPDDAVDSLTAAARCLNSAGQLFPLLATMRREAFRTFRQFTEGASAIQSQQYKRFELICSIPRVDRLSSPAFTSVPEVRAAAVANPDTLTAAFFDTAADELTPHEQLALLWAFTDLERCHQRWKTTHHSLASRMLGDAGGTGYTVGVPYLKSCVDNRLFWQIGLTANAEETANAVEV